VDLLAIAQGRAENHEEAQRESLKRIPGEAAR
jgi:hypothetical protein